MKGFSLLKRLLKGWNLQEHWTLEGREGKGSLKSRGEGMKDEERGTVGKCHKLHDFALRQL